MRLSTTSMDDRNITRMFGGKLIMIKFWKSLHNVPKYYRNKKELYS